MQFLKHLMLEKLDIDKFTSLGPAPAILKNVAAPFDLGLIAFGIIELF